MCAVPQQSIYFHTVVVDPKFYDLIDGGHKYLIYKKIKQGSPTPPPLSDFYFL